MEIKDVRVQLDDGAYMPDRAHALDGGADIMSPVDVLVPARSSMTVDTGVHVEIPQGYVGLLKSKSSLNILHGITSEGVIDAGYTGSMRVKMYNNSDDDYQMRRGDKISQLVLVPVITPKFVRAGRIEGGERGSNGFGSTGRSVAGK